MKFSHPLRNSVFFGLIILVFASSLVSSNQTAQAQDEGPGGMQPTVVPTFPAEAEIETPDPDNPFYIEPTYSEDGNTAYNLRPPLIVMPNPFPEFPAQKVKDRQGLKQTAKFEIDYFVSGEDDIWHNHCATPSEAFRDAFQYAADIWATEINSSVPITIKVCFARITIDPPLGVSGGEESYMNFSNKVKENTWYTSSLANAILGEDKNPDKHDMQITINSFFPDPGDSWYLGTDGQPGLTQFDLVTVAMHEIGHGLGFGGTANAVEVDPVHAPGVYEGSFGSLANGIRYPDIYDTFMQDAADKLLINYSNPSIALGSLLTSQNLWFNGKLAKEANGDNLVPMYAPNDWDDGSSYCHVDEVFNGTINELMTFSQDINQARHDIGPVLRGLLMDLGWQIAIPPSPEIISPKGNYYSKVPTFKWTPITDAYRYSIKVYFGGEEVYKVQPGSSYCNDTVCTFKPNDLILDYYAYTWRVSANAYGAIWSDWSPVTQFIVKVAIPKPNTPSGNIVDRTPTYTWTGVSGADSYNLIIKRGTTTVLNKTITASAACVGTSCKTTPDTLLKYASHTWKIQAHKDGNLSSFSGDKTFKVVVPVPTPKMPSGNIYITKPIYKWPSQEYVTNYQIQVDSGTPVTLTSTSVCSAGWCSYTQTTALTYAAHTWRLMAKAEGVWSEWSGTLSFNVNGPATPQSPSGNTYTREPTYKWSKVTGATQYKFEVYKGTTLVDTQTVSSSVCGTTACEYKPISKVLDYAAHTWKVQAFAGGAWRTFSSVKAFTVINPVPTAKSPTGTIYDNTPQFIWTKIIGATQYRFEVSDNTTSALIYTQTVTNPTCNTTNCDNTPTNLLSYNTTYKWRVQSYAGGAWQTYSSYLTFTPRVDTPVLQSPNGTIYVLKPTYKWTPVFNAESYEIELSGNYNATYTIPTSACSGSVCTKLSDDTLFYSGMYNWRARAKVSGTWKPWSGLLDFNIVDPIPVPLNPTGLMYAYTPVMSWNEVPGATNYYIEVYHQDGTFVDSLYISAPSCINSICKAKLDFDLNGTNYDYKWHIQSVAGGDWSDYSSFREFHYQPIHSGSTVRTSLTLNGTEANSYSKSPAISADGKRIAFMSNANNMGEWVYEYTWCIFIYDLDEGTTRMVSRVFEGYQTYENADYPAISGDGRYVGFSSESDKMVPNDTNGEISDVFLHDTQTGARVIISVNSSEVQGNGGSSVPFISNNGRFVAFQSSASNLIDADTNGTTDVFVRDVQTGTTTRVSVSGSGEQANNYSIIQGISADGNYVVFLSTATNLVSDDTNGVMDVFVHNMTTGSTTRASTASDGTEAVAFSEYASISDDGRYVTFSSRSYNLVTADTNEFADVFLKDLQTGSLIRISINGPEANNRSDFSKISGDGSMVIFSSDASNLIDEGLDTNYSRDVFLYNVSTQTITRVSVSTSGFQAAGDSDRPVLSFSGQYIAFMSDAINLISGDTNNRDDIFLHLR